MNLIDSMRVFAKIAETSSFTKTAESLGLPKATVSGAIQDLEERLGTRLLQRTTRKVQMTQDGLSFFERCKDMIADVDEVETMFKRGTKNISGRIRVDMPNGIARRIILPHLPEFLEKYPLIEIEFSSTDRKVDVIQEGFDFVVRVGTNAESGLIARKIAEFEMMNCASPAYIKKFGKPKKIEDLQNHKLVHYVRTLGMKSEGFDYFDGEKTVDVSMPGSMTVNNADAQAGACLAGLGIIQAPRSPHEASLKSGELVEVLPNFKSQPMPIAIIYPHRRQLPQRVQLFMAWVIETIQSNLKEGWAKTSR